MRVVLTGGGTGGHISPALAIAEKLKKGSGKVEILYIGSKDTMEKDIVPAHGFKYVGIDTAPLNKKITKHIFKNLFKLVKGYFQVRKILKSFNPDVVVGTGGYVSGTVVLAAAVKGIPTCIHEQNAIPGMTNKWLSKVVDKVMLSFDEAREHFKPKEKLVFTGLPVMQGFFNQNREEARKKLGIPEDAFLVLSVGGSNGALKFNEYLINSYARLSDVEQMKFVHVTGRRYHPFVLEHIEKGEWSKSDATEILDFTNQMPLYLGAADLIISRAGSATLNEIIAATTPSVIIPSPNVANNHQFHNAKVIDKYGMGVVIEEKDVTLDLIEHTIRDLYASPAKLEIMRKNCSNMDMRQSLDAIAALVIELGKKKKK